MSAWTNKFKRKLKANLFFRFLAFPYMSVKKKMDYQLYQNGEDAEKISGLRDRLKDSRCFIIGNGPSLLAEDLEKLKDEITFASNRIYNLFELTDWRPTFYMAEDMDAMAEIIPHILNQRIPNIVLGSGAKKLVRDSADNIYWGQWGNGNYVVNRYNDKSVHISKDVSKYFCVGYTVTFSAIQLALFMGIREIYLLGVDFNYSVAAGKWGRMTRLDGVQTYFDGKERSGSYLNYYSTLYAYQAAREYCDSNNIKIYNATRGGRLEVFERVDFDELMGGKM